MTLQPNYNFENCKNIIMLAKEEISGQLVPISQHMIVQYESKIEMYERENDTYKSQIETYKINVDTCKSQIETQKNIIDTYKSQIDDYKEKLKKKEIKAGALFGMIGAIVGALIGAYNTQWKTNTDNFTVVKQEFLKVDQQTIQVLLICRMLTCTI